jgi:hypothetical protein
MLPRRPRDKVVARLVAPGGRARRHSSARRGTAKARPPHQPQRQPRRVTAYAEAITTSTGRSQTSRRINSRLAMRRARRGRVHVCRSSNTLASPRRGDHYRNRGSFSAALLVVDDVLRRVRKGAIIVLHGSAGSRSSGSGGSLAAAKASAVRRVGLRPRLPIEHRPARVLSGYLRWYNKRRPHSSLRAQPPISRVSHLCGHDS